MDSMISDIKLAPSGHDKIEWVKNFMPVMAAIDAEFSKTNPLQVKKWLLPCIWKQKRPIWQRFLNMLELM